MTNGAFAALKHKAEADLLSACLEMIEQQERTIMEQAERIVKLTGELRILKAAETPEGVTQV